MAHARRTIPCRQTRCEPDVMIVSRELCFAISCVLVSSGIEMKTLPVMNEHRITRSSTMRSISKITHTCRWERSGKIDTSLCL